MHFIAKLHHNFQGVHRIDKKVLLTSIHNIDEDLPFRDHAWVPITEALEALIPKSNRSSRIVTFQADIKPYPHDSTKYRLHRVREVKKSKKI